MKTFVAVIAAATTLGLGACAYNESLGRNQFLIVDDSALMQQSNAAWAETLRSQKVSTNAAQNERVRRVGGRMVQAAGLAGRQWDYAVFEDASPNAFVLPSGQIGVTTGLLKLVQNDDQLATVIGHEVGHVVARHAAERYSTQSTTGLVLGAVQSRAGDYSQAIGALGGMGAQLGLLLPFSRSHELEADRLGVDYVATAGYKPSESIALWRLMAQQRQSGTPEFASTHPSDQTRITALQQYIASRGWN
ncbi:M48 family metallopeptidase [Brevundimonas sp. P7753]|uniref:M48 family metallopeptidase n=1 Tax=Brevundimonas sp. P7753 TaxID=2726982 RepID=UPI0015C063D6|nr:M48 family metallopeptidase [Brevundimonas sp. P7753]NWE52081.1 M48 family metallopeptidase [Brevundimonas sp. P7753]